MNKNIRFRKNLYKEEYLVYKKLNKDFIFNTFKKLNLIKNLKQNNKSIYSYNETVFLKIKKIKSFYELILFCNKKNILKYRKLILFYFRRINILSSEYYLNKSLRFYKKFLEYENFLRKSILIIMSEKDKNWFNNLNISNFCNKRKHKDKNYFHPLYYSDFLDLDYIIKKYWNELSYLLRGNSNKIMNINKKRNIMFHGRF